MGWPFPQALHCDPSPQGRCPAEATRSWSHGENCHSPWGREQHRSPPAPKGAQTLSWKAGPTQPGHLPAQATQATEDPRNQGLEDSVWVDSACVTPQHLAGALGRRRNHSRITEAPGTPISFLRPWSPFPCRTLTSHACPPSPPDSDPPSGQSPGGATWPPEPQLPHLRDDLPATPTGHQVESTLHPTGGLRQGNSD